MAAVTENLYYYFRQNKVCVTPQVDGIAQWLGRRSLARAVRRRTGARRRRWVVL